MSFLAILDEITKYCIIFHFSNYTINQLIEIISLFKQLSQLKSITNIFYKDKTYYKKCKNCLFDATIKRKTLYLLAIY